MEDLDKLFELIIKIEKELDKSNQNYILKIHLI